MSRVDLLKKYLADNPDDPFLHFALAKEFEGQQELEVAKSKYEYLVEQHAEYVGTYYHLGKLYELLEDTDKAEQCYEAGIKVAKAAGDTHSAGELRGALDELIF